MSGHLQGCKADVYPAYNAGPCTCAQIQQALLTEALEDNTRKTQAAMDQQDELTRLREITSVGMGVGDGTGNLFVYGNYESIKAAQQIVMDNTQLRTERDEARKDAKVLATYCRQHLVPDDVTALKGKYLTGYAALTRHADGRKEKTQ